MTLNLTIPRQQHTDFSPRITVVGVGGAGCNAVNNMIAMGLDGVEFLVANTDAQALVHSRAERRVQLGPHLTQGLGAGAKPEIGRAAAEEATEDLARHLEGMHMVFITCGMGGGTGTGAAPVIARMARERGILTLGVVTKPFDFEGPKRRRAADAGIEELQTYVDTLIVIPNQNLFRKANERTTFAEAFKMADDVLYMGVRGVTDLMVNPGLVNLDFADIRTVMAEMGKAMMGTGEGEGDDRAVKAAEAAISNPLLEDTSMLGAKGVLINITGGYDMTLFEVDEAANRIRREVDEDANIIFGSSVDEDMNGRIRVSVVATGIDALPEAQAERPKLVAVGGGAPVNAVATAQVPQQQQPRGVMGAPIAPRPAVAPTA
ncbi:cell division protein FtsZ, partial [Acetobacteraceae bacterium AT-5844]